MDKLRKSALLLVWIGEIWNLLEMGVALWSGLRADSVALVAFGLDSFIELFVGFVLIWRLSKEWKGEEEQDADQKALRVIGVTFFLLAAFILLQSSATLLGWLPEPRPSLMGIILVLASALLMTALYFLKTDIAGKLGSRSLRAEAVESLICDLQDLTLLLGLGLNALLGWWWTDPVAALLLIPFLLKEGREAFSEEEE
ncbi:MAG: cation transporter [Chloroflexi bacterium]|nr:cation transporter [Chloroflexota bacterium]